jgi:hypothetical protein
VPRSLLPLTRSPYGLAVSSDGSALVIAGAYAWLGVRRRRAFNPRALRPTHARTLPTLTPHTHSHARFCCADAWNARVRRLDLRSGVVTTLAGSGGRPDARWGPAQWAAAYESAPATAVALSFPLAVALLPPAAGSGSGSDERLVVA